MALGAMLCFIDWCVLRLHLCTLMWLLEVVGVKKTKKAFNMVIFIDGMRENE